MGEWALFPAITPGFLFIGVMFGIPVFVGRWDIAGYYFQTALVIAFLIICFSKGPLAGFGAIAYLLLLRFLLSRQPAEPLLELSFPLRNGWYYTAHGGARGIVNGHARIEFQQYALDIVRLNALGFRARGIYPSELEAYAIFHDVLYSPCDGTVTAIVNDLPDLSPGEMDTKHLAGNHIVIQFGDETFVGLAHLAQGSIRVRVGDTVETGQPLAQIGNSGNTTEPHLHIHAKRGGKPDSMLDGEGVAIRFDGRWLIRNSIVHAASA